MPFFIYLFMAVCTLAGSQIYAQCNTPDELSITYSCPSSNRVSFSATTSSCVTNLQWNFGDIASGSLNSAADVTTATHTFTTPGAYTVTITATGQNGKTLTQTQPINIINVTIKILANLCISEPKYDAQILVTGVNTYNIVEKGPTYPDPFYFSWTNSDTPFTLGFNGYFSGYFDITVSAANACPVKTGFALPLPFPPLSHTTAITPANCSLSNGAIAVTESGGTPPYNYSWRPAVSQNAAASNLPKAYYYITVKDDNGCLDNFSAAVGTKEAAIKHEEDIKQPICTANGAIAITPSGGVAPYTYSWMPAVSASSSAKGLAAGTYTIEVKDKNGCSEQVNIKLQQQSAVLDVQTDIAAPDCGTADGSITLLPSRGTAPYTYAWALPVATTEATADSLAAGTYQAAVTDANGCSGAVTATLYEKLLTVSLGKDTFLCPGHTITLSAGTFDSYRWNDLSKQPTLAVNAPGTYSVTVANAGGCNAKASIVIESGCGDIVFPSAFTPNGDFRNDQFGPIGSLSEINNYSLQIYSRSGALVFRSQDPYEKWNGKVNGISMITGTYVFIAAFEFEGKKRTKKGTITLIL